MEVLYGAGKPERLLPPPEEVFVCFAGLERSRRISRAFNDAGKITTSFKGGTKRLSALSIEDIKNEILPDTQVTVIYEDGSKQEEYDAKQRVLDKLKKAGLPYKTANIATIWARLRELDIDLSDYL